jgi:hypothetical protein
MTLEKLVTKENSTPIIQEKALEKHVTEENNTIIVNENEYKDKMEKVQLEYKDTMEKKQLEDLLKLLKDIKYPTYTTSVEFSHDSITEKNRKELLTNYDCTITSIRDGKWITISWKPNQ